MLNKASSVHHAFQVNVEIFQWFQMSWVNMIDPLYRHPLSGPVSSCSPVLDSAFVLFVSFGFLVVLVIWLCLVWPLLSRLYILEMILNLGFVC